MQEVAQADMKILIDSLTERPRDLNETIPASEWDMSSSYLDFVDTITIEASVSKAQKVVHLEAQAYFTEKIICGRCLQEIIRPLQRAYTFDMTEYDANGFLDISSLIREELLLEYPIKTLCAADCKGICPVCGVNLNLEKCTCSKKEE